MQEQILVVDDDRQLTSFLERLLGKHGFLATAVGSAAQMRAALARHRFDLIVLDIGLPDSDGMELTRELRREHRIPIVMLTARDEVFDRIVGLELGADDYVTKPFEPRELLARIKAVLRRTSAGDQDDGFALPARRHLSFGGLTLDLYARALTCDKDESAIPLTEREFLLLRVLAEHSGQALSREHILTLVYGNSTMITDRAIDTQMSRLRRKLAEYTEPDQTIIRTVHGEGYVLAAYVTAA